MLSLEVSALQTLHRFQITERQLGALRTLAAETAPKNDERKPGKCSDRVRKKFLDLRDALVTGDADEVAESEEQLSQRLDEEESELDDHVKLTPQSIRRMPEFLQTLQPLQVAHYLIESAGELPDPLETLTDVLDVVSTLDDAEWKELRSQLQRELSWQLGGLDGTSAKGASERVGQYLAKIRGLGEKQIEAQRAELEKSAEQLVAQTRPTVVLNHAVEHALAELLSNPMLSTALAEYRAQEPDKK